MPHQRHLSPPRPIISSILAFLIPDPCSLLPPHPLRKKMDCETVELAESITCGHSSTVSQFHGSVFDRFAFPNPCVSRVPKEKKLERHIYGTYKSTYSFTGIASSRAGSSETSRIRCCCASLNRRRRLVLNFSISSGIPSSRRRRWPMGYSTVSSSTEPSSRSTRSALAIERFPGRDNRA